MIDPNQNPAEPKAETDTQQSAPDVPGAAPPEADAGMAKSADADAQPRQPAEPADADSAATGAATGAAAGAAEGAAPGAAPEADDPAPADAEPDPATVIAQLQEQVETTRDQMLRALAEAENTRRRAERDRQDIAKYALTDFARELLSPADNLRRALEAVPADAIGQDAVLANLNDGVAATERELLSALEKIGVKKIDSLDEKFDPNFHQAMFEVPDSGKPAGIVVQVIQEGFMIHDRLLRPALVGIAKAEPAQKVDTTA